MDKQILNAKKEYQTMKDIDEIKSSKLSKIRLFLFFIFLILLISLIKWNTPVLACLIVAVIIIFIFVAIHHNHIENEIKKLTTYLTTISKYEDRGSGTWKTNTSDQEETEHQFMPDLDIIGKNSLFQFINFTNSLGGKKRLIDKLSLKDFSKSSINSNQKAIQELKNNFKFSLHFQEKMSKIDKINKTDYKDYLYFFESKPKNSSKELIVSLIITTITIIVTILTLLGLIHSFYLTGLIILELISSYVYIFLYNEDFEKISKYTRAYRELKDIYKYIETQEFTSPKLKQIKRNIDKGNIILNKLTKIADLDSYRNNFITYVIFNCFASLNFVIHYKYIKLLNDNNEDFETSIKCLEELESLISLTTIGYVKETITLPKITDEISLNMENMKHPLLKEEECISNDFNCDKNINIITGSNMSGKTSFMRTIGINLILAYTGTYTTADNFSCPILKIFTSINVRDDITNGISTFYGELRRIKAVLDYSKKSSEPMIIFIDEIFKGTNYNDRILGAKETLRKFSALNCIVFLTTHDFELCEINNKKINNYHFKETYEKDKIHFDYKIKKGICQTTNAKYLMKQMNIID